MTHDCPVCETGKIVVMHHNHRYRAACSNGCFTLPTEADKAYDSLSICEEKIEQVVKALRAGDRGKPGYKPKGDFRIPRP